MGACDPLGPIVTPARAKTSVQEHLTSHVCVHIAQWCPGADLSPLAPFQTQLVFQVPPARARRGVCPSLNWVLEQGQGRAARCVLATAIARSARGTYCPLSRGPGPWLREGGHGGLDAG